MSLWCLCGCGMGGDMLVWLLNFWFIRPPATSFCLQLNCFVKLLIQFFRGSFYVFSTSFLLQLNDPRDKTPKVLPLKRRMCYIY